MLIYHHLGVRRLGDVTVVRFGDHRISDSLEVNRIGEELEDIARRVAEGKLLLNFAGVVALSSLFLSKLLRFQRTVTGYGGRLALSDLEPEVAELFATTRLEQVFRICESEQDALRYLDHRPSPGNEAPQGESET